MSDDGGEADPGDADELGRHARRIIMRLLTAGVLGAVALVVLGFTRGDAGLAGVVGVVVALVLLVIVRWANQSVKVRRGRGNGPRFRGP